MSGHHPRSGPAPLPRQRVVRGILALAGAVLLFIVGLHFEALYGLEAAARDFDARTRAATPSDSIILVTITDADYDSMFGGRSPLDADSLGSLLRTLARAHPRVVGVDLDTGHPSFRRLVPFADSLAAVRVRVIWGRDAAACDDSMVVTAGTCEALHPLAWLGDTAAKPHLTSGLATMPLDVAGTVRYYSRLVPLRGGAVAPSFSWALRTAFGPAAWRQGSAPDTAPRFIAFHPGSAAVLHLSARKVLELGSSPDSGRGILGDRAVIVGGSYRAARDDHDTPLGARPGVEVQALALQTEFDGGGEGLPSLFWLGVLQCITGSIVIILLVVLSPARAMAALALFVPLLSILGSLAITHRPWAGVWYFLPLFVLVIVEQLYEKAAFYRELLVIEFYHQARGLPSAVESVGPAIERVDARLTDTARRALRRAISGVRNLRRKARTSADEPLSTPPGPGPHVEG